MSQTHSIQITHRCPKENCRAQLHTPADRAGRVETKCPRCEEPIVLEVDADLHENQIVRKCALCPGREFFIRRDFPQKLGLMMVIVFGLVATVFYAMENIVATFATLGGLVLIDAVIFLVVGKVTVCYRCRAEFRGMADVSEHAGFDLATSEKYR